MPVVAAKIIIANGVVPFLVKQGSESLFALWAARYDYATAALRDGRWLFNEMRKIVLAQFGS
jgi:hypothetical protein